MGISPLQTRAFMFKFENYAGFLYPNLGQIDTFKHNVGVCMTKNF